ncbi:MAG TPA: amidohydrolase family protein [Stellaceae bacterium]|nr:amidohydrolase family protein [Stellaceae bacterium]
MSREHAMFSGECGHCARGAAAPVSRRGFVAGAAALGALAAAGPGFAGRALAQAAPHRIDVHHHLSPPGLLEALKKIKRDNPPMANWSVQKSLDDMEKGGVATAILSPTTPQVIPFDKDEATLLARQSNEYARGLASDHPGRFGVFAMLPLPHIDESLKEIAHAFDVLKVDGVGLMTSYRDKWLGYAEFAPVWEELDRRKATVYTHPTEANCCVNLVQGIPSAVVEYGADTTRTIASLLFSGTTQRYKSINWIFSHGGGALTAFAERFQIQMVKAPDYKDKFTREVVDGELRRFHYDTAAIANSVTIGALAKLVPASQILLGTDFPYRNAAEYVGGLAATFGPDDLKAIVRENALRLMPRLKTA